MEANARIATERGYLNIPEGTVADLSDLESISDGQGDHPLHGLPGRADVYRCPDGP